MSAGHKHHGAGKSLFSLQHPKDNCSTITYCVSHLEVSGVSETYTCFSSFALQHRLSREGITKLQQRWQAHALYPAADTRSSCSYWPRRQDWDIYTAASWKSLGRDRQREEENARAVSTHPFTPWRTRRAAPRRCEAETAAPAKCPPAESAAAAHRCPPLQWLQKMHPKAGAGTA